MTFDDLVKKFNDEFSFGDWPKDYEVDAVTYANVCQVLFERAPIKFGIVKIALGINRGIMLKNVELILRKELIEPRTAAGSLD